MKLEGHRKDKTKHNILFRNFDIFLESEKSFNNFKSLIFKLAVKGKLDFQKLSEGRIKKPLQALVKEQKQHLKKEGIPFEESSDSIWPMVELEKILEKIKYTNKIKTSNFLKDGTFPIIDQSENFIAGYWNNQTDVFKVNSSIIIFGDHTCCFKYIDFDFVLGADGVKIIQPKKQFFPAFLYYLLLNTKITNSGYSRHFKFLKKIKIPLPPLAVQKEIVALMEKVVRLETQTKEKSQKQKKFSKSSMYFITQSKNTKEISHYWDILENNLKNVLYSENRVKLFKAMVFQLCLNGRLDFQKLSEGRIKKPLQALVKEQKQHLKKEGIPFEELSGCVWPMVELGDLCTVVIGRTPRRDTPEYFGGNNVWVSIRDMNQKIILETKEHITDTGVKASNSKKIKKGTVLLSFKLSIGKVSIANTDLYTNEAIASLPIKNEYEQSISRDFLFNKLCDLDFTQIQPKKVVKGKTLNKKSLSKIKIPLPPLAVQKEIVALMEYIENMEKRLKKEKNLNLQLSQSLCHLEKYQKIV